MSRDSGLYEAALGVLRKGTSREARRAALAYLGERGVDEYAALAEARERPGLSGVPGPLAKASEGRGDVVVSRELAGGRKLTLEMSRPEANGLVCAVFDALGGRRA